MSLSSNSHRKKPLEPGLTAMLNETHLGSGMHAKLQSNLSSDKEIAICVALRNGKKMDGSLRKQEIHFQPCMEPLVTKHEGFLPTKEWSRMEQSHASFLAPDLC